MNTAAPSAHLAQLLVNAQRERSPLGELDHGLYPKDFADAYQTQQAIFSLRGIEAGGWKIGSKSPTGPVQGSPLPAQCLHAPGSAFARADYAPVGLELEIAFRFKHDFTPRDEDYSEAEVHAGIGEMAATIEIVSSRFAAFPKVEPLTQLADLLNHGALVVGEFVPYRDDFPFAQPTLALTFNDESIVPGPAANPAGDPRRLLTWLVNHHTRNGKTLPKDFVITTGSFTGMYFAKAAGELKGEISGMPPVSLSLT
ncbi:2-keto-4-pentenoate hydratase [Pseudomonas sp. PSKL.D1]|uniref:2-keto-4-pentenoate hydratase n=1 Tax=Pseudomonas sp. PSKL.D1 TaxID=3029060 RepID=UPI00238131EA|nr:2-keto-4-pentenoate hydratase [Pseudomonas sp. PSKL.D1]WDY55794.1 2-keto-4-pentenoate hydratase [Pseudomonas sp. PSKL.D1]